jgi:hypothetical protein
LSSTDFEATIWQGIYSCFAGEVKRSMWNWTLQTESKPQDGFPWEEPHTETSWSSDSNLVVAGGRARGYNPQKKGRPSHHPLFACVADLRLVLHPWLRPGNSADSRGLITFFDEEAVAPLPIRHPQAVWRRCPGDSRGRGGTNRFINCLIDDGVWPFARQFHGPASHQNP